MTNLRLTAGLALFAVGLFLVGRTGPFVGPLLFVGMVMPAIWIVASATGVLLRRRPIPDPGEPASAYAGSSYHTHIHVPRDVFGLLASIAAANGSSPRAERDLVRQFVIERFDDPEVVRDLRDWNVTPLRGRELESLARRLSLALTFADRDILFVWCCLITLADERFTPAEREALRVVAAGLNLETIHARRLFHRAKHEILGDRRRTTLTQHTARAEAFEILGLSPDATPEAIRKRHRELVKKFHPTPRPPSAPPRASTPWSASARSSAPTRSSAADVPPANLRA